MIDVHCAVVHGEFIVTITLPLLTDSAGTIRPLKALGP